MNTTVWKYTLPITDSIDIDMPVGAEPLTVALQGDQVYLWARVNPVVRREPRTFRIAGTGHPMATGDYVGTVMLHGGALVFHVFDQH